MSHVVDASSEDQPGSTNRGVFHLHTEMKFTLVCDSNLFINNTHDDM
jgi:hypothetical protein